MNQRIEKGHVARSFLGGNSQTTLLLKMHERRKFLLEIVALHFAIIAVNGACYPTATYQATAGRYSCRLHQTNWAEETFFEVTYKHCLHEPTFGALIRNFHGLDEINMDFNEEVTSCAVMTYGGTASEIRLEYSMIEAEPRFGTEAQMQLQVTYVPYAGQVHLPTYQLLTAVFPMGDNSDCLWIETLPVGDQVLFTAGLSCGSILFLTLLVCYCRYRRTSKQYQPSERLNENLQLELIAH